MPSIPPFEPGLDTFQRTDHQLFMHLIRRADRRFAEAQRLKAAWRDANDVRAWQKQCRQVFLDAVGGLPDAPCDLAPRITGRVEREAFTIDKVMFQSLPDWWVTSNLYLPRQRSGRTPAVMVLSGHSRPAKAYAVYHQACAMLARNGFIVIAPDPPGQGERMQCIDRTSGAEWLAFGVLEHCHLGLGQTLLGQNIARYFVYDAMRAIDYLLTRPEVDPQRIGVTGNSGGGTQSCYMMLTEDRLAAAAPACYVTSRQRYIRTDQQHDAEQNLFGAISRHLDYQDFLIGFAPRPMLLLPVAYDFFPIEGAEEAHAAARRAYELMGAPDACQLHVDAASHGFTTPNRVAMVKFFAEALGHREQSELDLEVPEAVPEKEMWCTRSGQVLVDDPQAATLMDLAHADAQHLTTAPEQVRDAVRELVWNEREALPIRPRLLPVRDEEGGVHWERLFFFSEEEIAVTGTYLRPVALTQGAEATVMLIPEGTPSLEHFQIAALRRWFTEGRSALVFDPRGCGILAGDVLQRRQQRGVLGPWYRASCNAWMLGDNLVAMRAFDICQALAYLRTRPDVDPQRVGVYGEGDMAMPALLAAVADGQVSHAVFHDLPESYREALGSDYRRELISEWTCIYGMLRKFDIPDLLAALPCEPRVAFAQQPQEIGSAAAGG